MSDTEKLELYTPQHYLLNAQEMSMEALAVVTDTDLDEYEEEHAIYLAKQKEAVELTHSLYTSAEKDICKIFGHFSNEHKYLKRAIGKGTALTDIHSREIVSPSRLREQVKNARNKVDVTKLHTSSTVSDNGLLEINNALEYLVNNGLKLNKDFTLTNAVAVAKSHKGTQLMSRIISQDMELDIHDEDVRFIGEKQCGDETVCGSKYDITTRSDNLELMARCCCGDTDYTVDFGFSDDGDSVIELAVKN